MVGPDYYDVYGIRNTCEYVLPHVLSISNMSKIAKMLKKLRRESELEIVPSRLSRIQRGIGIYSSMSFMRPCTRSTRDRSITLLSHSASKHVSFDEIIMIDLTAGGVSHHGPL